MRVLVATDKLVEVTAVERVDNYLKFIPVVPCGKTYTYQCKDENDAILTLLEITKIGYFIQSELYRFSEEVTND